MPRVDPQLVGSPGQGVESEKRVAGEPFEHPIFGDGRFTALGNCRESFSIPWVTRDTGCDLTF